MKMMVATMVTVFTHLWTQSLTAEWSAFNMDFPNDANVDPEEYSQDDRSTLELGALMLLEY